MVPWGTLLLHGPLFLVEHIPCFPSDLNNGLAGWWLLIFYHHPTYDSAMKLTVSPLFVASLAVLSRVATESFPQFQMGPNWVPDLPSIEHTSKKTYGTSISSWFTHDYLVGGIPTPLKNMKVSWDYYSQSMEKNVPNHQYYIITSSYHLVPYT